MSDHAPSLKLTPPHDSYFELLKAFKEGKPLNYQQLHFLQWHHQRLSSPRLTPLLRYYQIPKKTGSFLLPQNLNKPNITNLKKRLELTLQVLHHGFELELTADQFKDLKKLATPELVFYHGNPYLTGAPLFPGGVPHIDFFQWGNLYGIVKYEFSMGEKEIEGNILVYFEDMQERSLEECIKEYAQHETLLQQNNLILAPKPIHQITPPKEEPSLTEAPRPRLQLRIEPRFYL